MLELLSAHVPGFDGDRWPLTAINEEETHVHGELRWTVAGRRVPGMGGEDVCLGDWWDGLTEAMAALAMGRSHTLDTCEQGSPAYLFEHGGSTVLLSIVASAGDGKPAPDWQRVPLSWEELVVGVQTFKGQLRALLRSEGPADLPEEWKARLSEWA